MLICSRTAFTSAKSFIAGRPIKRDTSRSLNGSCLRPCRADSPKTLFAAQTRLRGSPAILTGRIFDDRGNRMSPSHTNKLGVRYRYYVSHAILQQRRGEVGGSAACPPPRLKSLCLRASAATRHQWARLKCALADRDLIEQRVDSVTIKPAELEVRLFPAVRPSDDTAFLDLTGRNPQQLPTTVITLPWTAPSFAAVKGIVHSPSARRPAAEAGEPEALLTAIAKARRWIDDIRQGRIASFAEIASKKARANGISACWLPSPSCRPGSPQQTKALNWRPQRARGGRISAQNTPMATPSASETSALAAKAREMRATC